MSTLKHDVNADLSARPRSGPMFKADLAVNGLVGLSVSTLRFILTELAL